MTGDDVLPLFKGTAVDSIAHLDGDNTARHLDAETVQFMQRSQEFNTVSAHAYLGARGIKKALDLSCDIVICKFWSELVT